MMHTVELDISNRECDLEFAHILLGDNGYVHQVLRQVELASEKFQGFHSRGRGELYLGSRKTTCEDGVILANSLGTGVIFYSSYDIRQGVIPEEFEAFRETRTLLSRLNTAVLQGTRKLAALTSEWLNVYSTSQVQSLLEVAQTRQFVFSVTLRDETLRPAIRRMQKH
tara:strand:+ start:353 stop:856 length:504 start_codon:yes stop_codon:yes gene_type:complete